MKRPNPQKEADLFNARFEVGSAVEYREVKDGAGKLYVTRTPAEVLSGHTAVVWLEGKSGCVAVSHCLPVGGST